jgi:hypothetical protein
MQDLSSFQQNLVKTGVATSGGYVPPIKKETQVDALSYFNTPQAAPSAPQPSEQKPAGFDWGEHWKKLAAPTVGTVKAVGNFLTSAEQETGKILGDTIAANTGVQDTLTQNKLNEMDMINRVREQIAENKTQGKDTSHLDWVLAQAMGGQKTSQQQMSEIAPGSQASNEQALGAVGMMGLDVLSAGTYGSATKGMKAGKLGAEAPTAYKVAEEALTRGPKGFWEMVKGGAKTGMKAAPVGAAYGATGAMQEDGSVGDIATSAAIAGGATFALPVLGSVAQGVRQMIKPTTDRALAKLQPAYENMFGRTQTSRKAQAKSAKFNNDPVDLLMKKAKHGEVIPVKVKEVGGGQVWDTSEAIEKLQGDVSQLEDNFLNPLLAASPTRVTFDEIRDKATQRLQGTMGNSSEYGSALAHMNATLDGYSKAPNFQKGALRLDQVNSMKSQEWGKARKIFGADRPQFQSNAEYQLGQALKEIVEAGMPNEAGIPELNKFIGHHAATIEQLSKINNSGVGNMKMGKNFMRTVGAIAGGATGGTPGAIGGAMTGDQISALLGKHAISDPFMAQSLENIQKTNPALIQQLVEYLPQYADDVAGKVKLPAKNNFGVLDLSGGKQTKIGQKPTKVPVQEAGTVVAGDKSKKLMIADKSGKGMEAMALAPLGFEQDENGNTSFSMEKALGIVGSIYGGKKLAPEAMRSMNALRERLYKEQRKTTNKSIQKQLSKAIKEVEDKLDEEMARNR